MAGPHEVEETHQGGRHDVAPLASAPLSALARRTRHRRRHRRVAGPPQRRPRRLGATTAAPATAPSSSTRRVCSTCPAGFSYTVLAVSDGVLANGVPVPATTLTDGGENSPSRIDGSGSFPRRGGGAVLVQNHENSNVVVFPVPHRRRAHVRLRHRLGRHDHPDRRPLRAPRVRGRQPRRHVQQLRRRRHPVEHVADLRGDRDQGRPERCAQGPRVRLRGRSVRHVAQHGSSADQGLRPLRRTRRSSSTRAADTRTAPRTPGRPTDSSTAGRRTATRRRKSYRDLSATAGTLEAMYATKHGTFVPDLSVYSTLGTTLDVTWKAVPDRDATTTSTRKQFDYLKADATGAYTSRSPAPQGRSPGRARSRARGGVAAASSSTAPTPVPPTALSARMTDRSGSST